MSPRKMIPLTSPEQVPPHMSEAEARAFWDTHAVTDEYLQAAGPVPGDALPPVRPASTHIALRIQADVLQRIRVLARKKRKGYQTLLKEFVIERLYEEEKREGLLG